MAKEKKKCCPAKPELQDRELLDETQANALENTFKVLANATRLRLLHALVQSEVLCVGELAEKVGMSPQAVSNQLQRLSDRGVVESRRDGLQMHYRVIDPCVVTLLDRGWCLTEDAADRVATQPKRGKVAS